MLDWRGSSGSLWGRGSKGEPDILTGTKDEGRFPDFGKGNNKSRRRGLRKRFLSLTEGLATLLNGTDKKERDRSVPRGGSKDKTFEGSDLTSGYSSDLDQRSECRRTNSIGSVSSFRPSLALKKSADNSQSLASSSTSSKQPAEWKSPLLERRSTESNIKPRPGKAPPSPPPRRYSLWAFPDSDDFNDSLKAPLSAHISSFITSPPQLKPPPPPPPVRFCNQYNPSSSPPSSPLIRSRESLTRLHHHHTSHSPSPVLSPKRPESPIYRDLDSLLYSSYTPPATPLMKHSLSNKGTTPPRFTRAPSESTDQRTDWYRRKALTRRSQFTPVVGGAGVVTRCVGILLEKEGGSFGFTVRGGASQEPTKTRPLIVTHVRPGGPADREGTMKAGDRLIAVEGRDITKCSLVEAQETLKRVERSATLTIEYDVSVMDSVRSCGGPLLVEIERTPGTSLGITLTHGHPDSGTIIIESIRNASIAERCGALLEGDIVAAIDGTRLDQLTVAEATQLLKTAPGSHVTLEIIPSAASGTRIPFRKGGGVAFPHLYNGSSSTNGYPGSYMSPSSSTYNTLTSRQRGPTSRKSQNRRLNDCNDSSSSSSAGGVSHTESLTVTLVGEPRGCYGLVLRPPLHHGDPDTALPTVAALDPGGPADKSSVICICDRLVCVNGRNVAGIGVSEITQIINNSRPTVTLDLEFEVADSVVPSSGTFAVKLAKKHSGLGITITSKRKSSSSSSVGEAILISEVTRGSSAHRTGTIQPGDRLLAIDQSRVDNLSLEDAKELLNCCGDIVTLRIQKDELYSDEGGGLVVYTVELLRNGGALGITLSGSEEPFDPIFIAGLAQGGLADRTGAIHTGDRLLAINGSSLRGKPLSEAIVLLQNSGDTVNLKISRPRDSGVSSTELPREEWMTKYGPAPPSVDSAVESWDSSALDPPTGSTPAQSKRDSGSDIFRSDCGSTVKRKGGLDDPSANTTLTSHQETSGDVTSRWDAPSPQPSVDSGQSEDKTDWDKMIADLNQISETCGLREPANPLPLTKSSSSTFCATTSENTTTLSPIIAGSVIPSVTITASSSTSSVPNILQQNNDAQDQTTTETQNEKTDMTGNSNTSNNQPSQQETEKILKPILRCSTLGTSSGSSSKRRTQGSSSSTEEGSYSVTNAALAYNASHTRAVSPPPLVSPSITSGQQVFQVTLIKDRFYEDFGFSVSDGLYEKGVYVNRIRKGGPADRCAILKPYDRILQVNDTQTHDFDCCLTVPLIASAGDCLCLILSRNPHISSFPLVQDPTPSLPSWQEEEEQLEPPSPRSINLLKKSPSSSSTFMSSPPLQQNSYNSTPQPFSTSYSQITNNSTSSSYSVTPSTFTTSLTVLKTV